MRNMLFVSLALASFATATPVAAVDLDLSIQVPGMSLYIGDRNRDGRYWDGDRWREENWWRDNCHRYEGRKNFRGRCEPRRGGDGGSEGHCPPGQAKKGRC
jgi:hypothetical protein